jgi:colicin import membrane protein
MKKAYLYFLLPLVGLVAFAVVYWRFSAGYEKRLADKAALVQKAKDDKIIQDNKDRERAVLEAKAAQEKRKAEKAAKDARDAQEKEDRETAKQALRKAQTDSDKLEAQVKRLGKEIEETKQVVAKIEEEKRRAAAEETFLKEYVKKTVANQANLLAVIEKIDAADKAIEAQQKAAAEAGKKK